MSEKLLHVSCIVRDTTLYDLLRAIEPYRAANLEVRAVAQAPLALPAPSKIDHGRLNEAILAVTPPGRKFKVHEIARELNANKNSVYSQISRDINKHLVKRLSYGLYVRKQGVTDHA